MSRCHLLLDQAASSAGWCSVLRFLCSLAVDAALASMSYDDIEIEDMEWNEELSAFTYPCPCGDLFQITKVLACCQLRQAYQRHMARCRLLLL